MTEFCGGIAIPRVITPHLAPADKGDQRPVVAIRVREKFFAPADLNVGTHRNSTTCWKLDSCH
jgi:hypothetical protein